MGTVGGNIYKELLVMLTLLVTVGLSSFAAAQLPDHLKALCPAYPNCDDALLAEYDKIYKASTLSAPAGGPQAPVSNSNELPCANYPFCDVNHAALAQGVPCANFPNCDVHHVAIAQRGKRQAATPVTPGNIPGLVPGSPAAAQWWAAQIVHQGQLAHHVGKRQAAIPLTPGNVPGLVPGSEAARQWWTNQLIWQQQQLAAAGRKKRQATEWPAGVSAASCPNYPYCDGLTAVVPVGYTNTAGYPAGVSAAICPNYPYCA